MKLVILITVIESLAVMLAIMCFYCRRSRSGKLALVLRSPHVSITEQAQAKRESVQEECIRDILESVSAIVGGAALFSTSKLKRNGTTSSFSKIKKADQAKRWFNSQPVKGGI